MLRRYSVGAEWGMKKITTMRSWACQTYGPEGLLVMQEARCRIYGDLESLFLSLRSEVLAGK